MYEAKSSGSTGLITFGEDIPEGTYILQVFGDVQGTVKARPAGSGETPQALSPYSAIANAANAWSQPQTAFVASGVDLFFDVTSLPASGSAYIALERIDVQPLG